MHTKPFLKWAGGKYKLVEFIQSHFPQKKYKRFIEPFAGSASLSLNVEFESYIINDINTDLINLYKTLKSEKISFIKYAKSFFDESMQNEKAFYELREIFNTTEDTQLKSALFIYLNRHAFNGLCRYNKSGKYNVPYGKYKSVYFPEKEMLAFVQKSNRMEFTNEDFNLLFKNVTDNDLIYCDPPYIPLTETASFTSYAQTKFEENQQILLAQTIEHVCNTKNCTVLVSNHDVPLAHKLYKNADNIKSVNVQRNIAATGTSRKKVSELIAIFNGDKNMIKGGIGGSNTKTGLHFEERTDLANLFLSIKGYELKKTSDDAGYEVWFNGELQANCFKKNEFYKFLNRYNIDWTNHLSKKLLPDNGLFLIVRDTLFIIEVKFQNVEGSVDEKLQTCDFKRKQYTKLVHQLGWRVEYLYILNDWFRKKQYTDTLSYIHEVGCNYFFNELPLKWLGLPSE